MGFELRCGKEAFVALVSLSTHLKNEEMEVRCGLGWVGEIKGCLVECRELGREV